ncbi:MAG: helix-turn-helix transcriptional regulator [Victivallales bacterium]|nr:helix-turn-helix transcriptional regulator [Victivallales bacterium]
MNDWLYRISPCLRIVGNAPTHFGWLEAMRYIYEHELVLFADNTYTLDIDGEKIECPPASFIIVPPGRRHVSRESGGRSGHRYWIHFDWLYAGDIADTPVMTYCPAKPEEKYFRYAPDFVPRYILHGKVNNWHTVMELFQRLENRFNNGGAREQMSCRGLLLEMLLELLTSEKEIASHANTVERQASKIRQRLYTLSDMPLNQTPPLREYLEQAGQSYAHQCRMFKQAYGIPPLQYVHELRMTRIKGLLRDTRMSISEIADMSGYDNLGYFSRMFKKSTGLSPRDFRKH